MLSSSPPLMAMILGLNAVEPESGTDSAVESFREELGIDLRSVTYAEMFMDLNVLAELVGDGMMDEEPELPRFSIAMHGEFDEAEIIGVITGNPETEYQTESYRGHTVHIFSDAGEEFDREESGAAVFLDSETLLFGSVPGVEAMLDVAEGAAPPLSGELRQALDFLGERHLGFAVELPPEFLEEMVMGADGEDVMPEMGLLGALDLGALVAPVSAMKLLLHDDAMEIEAVSLFEDNDAATASKEYSEGIVAMFGLMSDSPELLELASGMEVSQSGNAVTFGMTISSAAMGQLFAGLGVGVMPPQN